MNLIVAKTRKNDAFDKVAFDLRNCSPATFLHFEPDFKVEATMRFHTVLGQAVGTPHSKMHFIDDTQYSHKCEYACDFLRATGPLLPRAFLSHTDTQVRCIRVKTIAQQQAWGTIGFCIGATHNVGFCSETRFWSGTRETAFPPSVQTPVPFGSSNNRRGAMA
jgi:hypothetical protein